MQLPLEQRLLGHIIKAENGCWLLAGPRGGVERYPRIKVDGRQIMAHRLAYELWVGPITPGLCVCHRCDVTRCINPAHLFLGTSAENTQDRHAKGRSAAGERHGMARLTERQVRDIRELALVMSKPALAFAFGVSLRTIWNVVRYENWKGVSS